MDKTYIRKPRVLKTRMGKICPFDDAKRAPGVFLRCGNDSIPCHYCIGASRGTFKRDWIRNPHRSHGSKIVQLTRRP